MNTVEDVLEWVRVHSRTHPTHGINCACLDQCIRELRVMTRCEFPNEQLRVDYVLRTALENR